VAIVDDRVLDPQAVACTTDAFCPSLGRELARVHPYYGQDVRVPVLKLLDTRECVQAVDSTVGPEVEQHNASAHIAQRQASRRVDPVEAFL
jgi:hypothetical protein